MTAKTRSEKTISGLRLFLTALPLVGFLAPSLPRLADAAEPSSEAPAKDDLDVTITGEAKDQIAIIKTPPPLDIAFKDVVSLSREGQTLKVMTGPVEHMTGEEQMRLAQVDSRQTIMPLTVRIPRPPFFLLEVPSGVDPISWEFQIVDQKNQMVKKIQGNSFKSNFLEWDGYDNGVFKIRVGPAYTPILIVTDKSGKRQRFFGDPVQHDVVQYESDGFLNIEFSNERLYEKSSANFSKEMLPLLVACVNTMRQHVGKPFRIIIYEKQSSQSLAQKRLELWKRLLQDQLMADTDDLTVSVMTPKDAGEITAIMMMVAK